MLEHPASSAEVCPQGGDRFSPFSTLGDAACAQKESLTMSERWNLLLWEESGAKNGLGCVAM